MAAETEKLKQCCLCDYSVGGSDDKSLVMVSLGSEGREKTESGNLENEREWRGRTRTKPLKIQCCAHSYSQQSGTLREDG